MSLYPNSYEAWKERGVCWVDLDETEKAIPDLQRALQVPSSVHYCPLETFECNTFVVFLNLELWNKISNSLLSTVLNDVYCVVLYGFSLLSYDHLTYLLGSRRHSKSNR